MESTDRESEEFAAEQADTPAESDAPGSFVPEAGAEEPGEVEEPGGVEEPSLSDEELAQVAVAARPRTVPRYGAFIGIGVIVGLVLALVLFFALPTDGSSSSLTGLVYLAVLVTPFTALLGGLLAVLFERRSLRK